MHRDYQRANGWTSKVIAAAIEVHRDKGPGLLETIYERCMMRELELRKIPAVNQIIVPVEYKGMIFEQPLKLDVYVDKCLVLELKSVQEILPIHKSQLLSYMKLLNAPLGVLINFSEILLKNGIHRVILDGADKQT